MHLAEQGLDVCPLCSNNVDDLFLNHHDAKDFLHALQTPGMSLLMYCSIPCYKRLAPPPRGNCFSSGLIEG